MNAVNYFCEKLEIIGAEATTIGFLEVLRPEACNFIKKEALTQVFSWEICEISRNTFFTEHLRTTASVDAW